MATEHERQIFAVFAYPGKEFAVELWSFFCVLFEVEGSLAADHHLGVERFFCFFLCYLAVVLVVIKDRAHELFDRECLLFGSEVFDGFAEDHTLRGKCTQRCGELISELLDKNFFELIVGFLVGFGDRRSERRVVNFVLDLCGVFGTSEDNLARVLDGESCLQGLIIRIQSFDRCSVYQRVDRLGERDLFADIVSSNGYRYL